METVKKTELIMSQAGLNHRDRKVVEPALKKAEITGTPTVAIELPDGTMITGKTTETLNASSTCVINAIKTFCGIDPDIHLISPMILTPMFKLKKEVLGTSQPTLNLEETLIALSICAAINPVAEAALAKLPQLKNCEAHSTVILSDSDDRMFRKLGMHITCEAEFSSKSLYYLNQ